MKRLALSLLLAACAPIQPLPDAPVPYGSAITIEGTPVPLDPADPARQRLGNFAYAGGLMLTSAQTARLHGLSDLKVWPDGRLLAASDQSDLLEARLVLDAAGRLAGLTDARISAMKDENGVDLYAGGQREFDIEGIAELPNGDRIAAFEQHDRMFRFPKDGGLPVPAPLPRIAYKHNSGIEGLAADPSVGADAYRVAIESTGETYLCRLSTGCTPGPKVDLEGLELSALEILPGGRLAYLLRAYTPGFGNTIRLKIAAPDGRVIDGMELKRPLTVDNLEGLAAVPGRGGAIRFYLVSDDNFGSYAGLPTDQRTLLLAFDWRG